MQKSFLQCGSGASAFGPRRVLDASLWRFVILVGVALGLALGLGSIETGGAQRDYASCYWYATQEEAQAAFDAGNFDPVVADIDGDGIACENFDFANGQYLPDEGRPVVVVCNEATGKLVEVSQSALDQDSLDFPFHQATEAEITAYKCAVTSPMTTPVTPGGEGESNTVTALPVTGTATSVDRAQEGPLLVGLLVLTLVAIGLRSRVQRTLV